MEHDGFGVLLPLILLDMVKFDTILVFDRSGSIEFNGSTRLYLGKKRVVNYMSFDFLRLLLI